MALSKTQATILAMLSGEDAPVCMEEDRLVDLAIEFGGTPHANTIHVMVRDGLLFDCPLHERDSHRDCVQLTAKGDAALRRYRTKAQYHAAVLT